MDSISILKCVVLRLACGLYSLNGEQSKGQQRFEMSGRVPPSLDHTELFAVSSYLMLQSNNRV